MAVFDATFLVMLMDPQANPPVDPSTGQPTTHCKERIEYLITRLEQSAEKVVIPTPALSEFLVKAEQAAGEYLNFFSKRAVFQIAPFDTRGAVELSVLNATALASGDKFSGSKEPWQKVKFDRQIVAIAKVAGHKTVYSDDPGLRKFAVAIGLQAYGVHDIDLPPADAQGNLDLDADDLGGSS